MKNKMRGYRKLHQHNFFGRHFRYRVNSHSYSYSLSFLFTLLIISSCYLSFVSASSGLLSFFGASDVHFGHDVITSNGSITTSLELNIAAVTEMNALPLNDSWPESLGGGLVQTPVGLIITGDLIDNGYTEGYETDNFTHVYGLTGTDGLVRFPVLEGRGNHDGGNTTDPTEPHFVASMIVERNQVRQSYGSLFNITGISQSGLHYSWRWQVSDTCSAFFVMMNEYAGHICEGCSPVNCFYGPPCYTGWTYPEDSLGFLEEQLPLHIGASGEPVFVMQHYCFDGYSNSWYSENQREELFRTLTPYNTQGILCGHTHSAAIYSYNGTDQSDPGVGNGFIDVYNIPSTQKEDANGFPAPSEFMTFELSVDDNGLATFRAAQRVAYGWGNVMFKKTFQCPKSS